ncbi:hypothetical protein KA531_01270 [Candidatus Saccharibacteria bacterium]|nr:hypothetical protein [Candidatus Saccharibacteria bacterium]
MSGFKLISGHVSITKESLPLYKNAKSILVEDLILSLECIVDLMLGDNKEERELYSGSAHSQLNQLNQFCPILPGEDYLNWDDFLIKNLRALGIDQFNF